MVFLSPPNSNGLALSTFQARTNPPMTRALARREKVIWKMVTEHSCNPFADLESKSRSKW